MGDANNIIVGVRGKAYVADLGSTFPTGPQVAWGSDWTDLGYVTPDGLEEALAEEKTELDAWGEDAPVVTLTRKRTQTFKLTFRETTSKLLSLYYQVLEADMTSTAASGGNQQFIAFGSGSTSYEGIKVALGLDVIMGTHIHRFMCARCDVTERGNRTHNAENSSNFELTFTALTAPSGGQSVQHLITNVTLPTP